MTAWRRVGSRIRYALRRVRRWFHAHVPRSLWVAVIIPMILLATGTVAYRWIEGDHWSYFDGFFFTAITLTTIGYGELHELSDRGRAFTIVLAYGGIFTLAYFASELVRGVVTGELRQAIGRQWVDDKLATLSGHLIVCGYGRMGKVVCADLDRQKDWFVLIDRSEETLAELPYQYCLPLAGDGTTDELLKKAGIERARALVSVVGNDADNLYITLSARLLNPKLHIVARAEEEDAESKLRKVGANKIISPHLAGGHRAVQAVLHPGVLNFIEMAMQPGVLDLQLQEVKVEPGSTLAGQSLRQTRIQQEMGIIVVALTPPGGDVIYNPAPDTVLEAGASLIALGRRRQLADLERSSVSKS